MLKILFFAQLRETLGQDSLAVSYSNTTQTVADLTNELVGQNPNWSKALNNSSTLVAVNQTVVERSQPLNDGDEIAYFPPVTGG